MKRYVYLMSEEELGSLLASRSFPLEVLGREEGKVIFGVYEPLKGYRPLRVEEVPENWRSWREGFGPVEVEDLVIMPPWKLPVFIKPGTAFGTGLHPTTRLSLKALRESVRRGDSVLDVGTGSGILAVVAKLLGAGRVLGIDVCPDAVRECRENAELNRVEVECREAKPSQLKETFDLLVANLELSIFREELPFLKRLFRREAILSGIYGKEELEELLELCKQQDLEADRIYEEENWFAVRVGDGRT